MNRVLESEPIIRLIAFLSTFAVLAALEYLYPYRKRVSKRWVRWSHNLAMVGLSSVLIRLSSIILPIVWASQISQAKGGLFGYFDWNHGLEMLLSLLVLDCAIYLQHKLFHKVPLLWKVHAVHHSDLDLDVSSGVRFHPLEIFLSLVYKLIIISFFGISPEAVLVFEVMINILSHFNHSNIRIPQVLETILEKLIVTPRLHLVHHSVVLSQSHSNFGFSIILWDHLFRTYHPAKDDTIQIGLADKECAEEPTLMDLLLMPFSREKENLYTPYPLLSGAIQGNKLLLDIAQKQFVITFEPQNKKRIVEGISHLHTNPSHKSCQEVLKTLSTLPICWLGVKSSIKSHLSNWWLKESLCESFVFSELRYELMSMDLDSELELCLAQSPERFVDLVSHAYSQAQYLTKRVEGWLDCNQSSSNIDIIERLTDLGAQFLSDREIICSLELKNTPISPVLEKFCDKLISAMENDTPFVYPMLMSYQYLVQVLEQDIGRLLLRVHPEASSSYTPMYQWSELQCLNIPEGRLISQIRFWRVCLYCKEVVSLSRATSLLERD